MCWFNYKIVTGSQKKQVDVKLPLIHPKQNKKQTMHKSNEWIMHVKNKSNLIVVIWHKFTLSIKWEWVIKTLQIIRTFSVTCITDKISN